MSVKHTSAAFVAVVRDSVRKYFEDDGHRNPDGLPDGASSFTRKQWYAAAKLWKDMFPDMPGAFEPKISGWGRRAGQLRKEFEQVLSLCPSCRSATACKRALCFAGLYHPQPGRG